MPSINISASGVTPILPAIAGKSVRLTKHYIINNASTACNDSFQGTSGANITAIHFLANPGLGGQLANTIFSTAVGEGLQYSQDAAAVVGLDYEAFYA